MIESRYFQNEGCVKAVLAALEQIEYLPEAAFNNLPVAPTMPKEQANRLIRSKYFTFQLCPWLLTQVISRLL